ncbi:MAG: magnesium chelatase subunit D family protein [Actinomycetota bacterium]|nr:magnesium chelatase subunit D family protein [Actinomycetota bacterium]
MTIRPAHNYPFAAIVGQETLKTALLLNAIDPRVGGVLVRGEKGTAKSTAVRALADVLPDIDVVDECRFSCDPADPGSWCPECRERRESGTLPKATRQVRVIDLPVSATEDRLIGTLDLEHALKHGTRIFQPGLLAEANRAILYVDEVNLLDDHLVDTLLDAAAMGVNVVQREGVAFAHPARFILIGSMNPEEGDVRPQLLDRFGLCVDVTGVRDPERRVEIVRRRRAFEEDATQFARDWVDSQEELRMQLKHARLRLPSVELPDDVLLAIAKLCAQLGVDGHRADLVLARAASAFAAYESRPTVTLEDVRHVAPFALAHRLKRTPFDDHSEGEQRMHSSISSALGESDPGEKRDEPDAETGNGDGLAAALAALTEAREGDGAPEKAVLPGPVDFTASLDRARRSISGRRQETVAADSRGRYTRAEPAKTGATTVDVALDATIRAAAPYQASREGEMAIKIEPQDVHRKVRKRRVGASILFCVDASGSMGADSRMEAAKSAILELLVDAYQRRDRVGLVSFRGDEAHTVLAPTASVELAQLKMRSLPTGGATPLAHGMLRALDLIESERKRDTETIPWLVLVTDGRANVGLNGGLGSEDARAVAAKVRASKIHAVVLDTGAGTRGSSGAKEIAKAAGAEYVRLTRLSGGDIAESIRGRVHGT